MQLKAGLYSSVPKQAEVAKQGNKGLFNGIRAGVY